MKISTILRLVLVSILASLFILTNLSEFIKDFNIIKILLPILLIVSSIGYFITTTKSYVKWVSFAVFITTLTSMFVSGTTGFKITSYLNLPIGNNTKIQDYIVEDSNNIQDATLDMRTLMGKYTIYDNLQYLLYIQAPVMNVQEFSSARKPSTVTADVALKNGASVFLNSAYPWNINWTQYSSEVHADLSMYKVKTITVKSLGGYTELLVSDKYDEMTINVDGLFHSTKIIIPRNSGYKVNKEIGYSFLRADDALKIDEHTYQYNFDTADKKVIINYASKLGSLEVKHN